MKDDAIGGDDELDILKIYIWVMLLMTVVLGGLYYWFHKKATDTADRVDRGQRMLVDLAESKSEIQSMLKVYKTNKEDEARSTPLTWFPAVWRRKGINDASIDLNEWDATPRIDSKGGYLEENISIGIRARAPLSREKIAGFVHEVERASTRLRVLEMKLSRAGKKDQELEGDAWYGKVTIGYRVPQVNE